MKKRKQLNFAGNVNQLDIVANVISEFTIIEEKIAQGLWNQINDYFYGGYTYDISFNYLSIIAIFSHILDKTTMQVDIRSRKAAKK